MRVKETMFRVRQLTLMWSFVDLTIQRLARILYIQRAKTSDCAISQIAPSFFRESSHGHTALQNLSAQKLMILNQQRVIKKKT